MAGFRSKARGGWKKPRRGWMSERQKRARRRRIGFIAAAILAALACAALWLAPKLAPLLADRRAGQVAAWEGSLPPDAGLSVYFLDVGEADAAILTCDGAVMVVDGGNVGDAKRVYSMLHDTLGVERIDCMIASHPHEDHVGGLSGAIQACEVGTFYTPVEDYDAACYEITLRQARERGAQIAVPKPGDSFALGSARVEFLAPLYDYEDVNNDSIVCRVTYGGISFLFAGDAEREAEEDMVRAGLHLSADVLKVSHHGSDSSSSSAFLRKVHPSWAVISVGAGNEHGHPSQQVLDRLRSAGATVLRTDESGTICCTTDGKTVQFYCSGGE